MKKIFLSVLMAGALICGGTAFAQTPTDGNSGATKQTECCKDAKGAKKDKKDGKSKKGTKGLKGEKKNKPKFNPFDGVQLTDDQQQRLQVLRQGIGPVQLTPEMKAKIKENPNLTPEQKAQLKAERKAKKLENKKKYLNGVKEILTPEQYVVFLENVYLYTPKADKNFKGPKDARKAGKDFKGRKGDKPGKLKKPANNNTSAK